MCATGGGCGYGPVSSRTSKNSYSLKPIRRTTNWILKDFTDCPRITEDSVGGGGEQDGMGGGRLLYQRRLQIGQGIGIGIGICIRIGLGRGIGIGIDL